MNETIRSILERRSVRKFRPDPIARDKVDLIVKAGLYAPSAKNTQGWRLTVLLDRAAIDRVTAAVKTGIARLPADNPYHKLVGNPVYTVNYNAPVFIIVSADPAVAVMPEADCALVLGNMFVAAHSLGIGSCWINQLGALNHDAEFRAFLATLGVPAGNRIVGCGTFGYPSDTAAPAPARREGTVNVVE